MWEFQLGEGGAGHWSSVGCHLFRPVLISSQVVNVLLIPVVKYLEMNTFEV